MRVSVVIGAVLGGQKIPCQAGKDGSSARRVEVLIEAAGGNGVSTTNNFIHRVARSDLMRRTYGALRSNPVLGPVLSRMVRSAIPEGSRIWMRVPHGLAQGYWYYADPRSERGYTNGDHEPWLQDLLQSELGQGGCYYDVGAHSGFFAMIAARFVGPFGAIFAFEPDPKNKAILEANISRNGLCQITLLEVAAWSSEGQVTFEIAPEASNGTQGHICDAGRENRYRIVVAAVRLDDLVFKQGYRSPDLIKMDVEGAEWEALQGARRLLAEGKPKLLCEIHNPSQIGQIRSYLEELGYNVEEWKPSHPHYSDYRQLYLWAVPVRAREVLHAELSRS